MAESIIFNGRRIFLPGSYSTIVSGIKNPPQNLDYGRILVIDTGLGAGFGGGSGIAGEFNSGEDSVYQFSDLQAYRQYLKGGLLWRLAEPLFKPDGQIPGVSEVFHVKAATTTAAEKVFAPTGGGSNGGTITFKVRRDEGLIGNGVELSDVLTKGYAFVLSAGEVDTAKFLLRFFVGNWKGDHSDGFAFDEVAQAETVPTMVAESIEFATMDEFNAWATTDALFNTFFEASAFTSNGDGSLDADDLTAISGNQLFAGGTESYTSDALDSVLTAVAELDYSFILCLDSGANAQNAMNSKIQSHILDEGTKFEKFMIVSGGDGNTEFAEGVSNSSIETAKFFDSDRVTVVHGAALVTSQVTLTGFRDFGTIYKSASVLGRLAGLAPQIPITYKSLDIAAEKHVLTRTEREQAIQKGVLVTYFDRDFREFIVEQGINSLQNNDNLINANGTSYSIQLKRITSQINKELIQNSKLQLLSQEAGVNRNTLTSKNVEDWTKGYLQRITATPNADNLILGFQDVTVETRGEAYFVTYGITVNREVNKLFFTGFILG